MDSKIKIAPGKPSVGNVDEGGRPPNLVKTLPFAAVVIYATLTGWIIRANQELPYWVRENFGIGVFFAVSGILAIPEWKYAFVSIYGGPFSISVFATGFLTVIDTADSRGLQDSFDDDTAFWMRRSLLLSAPTAGLLVLAMLR
ncbi:MAG: hypothetical protein QG650_208 [Patescibacteria group bacterium]|nr:hypothetical protein [Patescibacteria group bacterium]